MTINSSDKIVDNLYDISSKLSDNEQIKTLIDLYNVDFLINNNIHSRYREKFIEKDWAVFNEFENYIKELVTITESFPTGLDSEKLCLLGQKLLAEKRDGLFPSVVMSYISRNGLDNPIEEVYVDKLLLALANNQFNNDQPLKALIVNALAPGYPSYDFPGLSNAAPDDIHFDLESLLADTLLEKSNLVNLEDFHGEPNKWLTYKNIVSSVPLEGLKEENILTPESFTFERLKSGKPKYSVLSPQHKVYASIVDNDLKMLQSIAYSSDYIKEIDFLKDDKLVYKLADKLSVGFDDNKVKRFLEEFVGTKLYQRHHPDQKIASTIDSSTVSTVKRKSGRGKFYEYLNRSGVAYDKKAVQNKWDMLLVENYKNNPNGDVLVLYKDFLEKHDLDISTATKKDGSNSFFKRVPMYAKDNQYTILEYVNNCLPNSAKLFSSKDEVVDIYNKVSELDEEAKRISHPVFSKFGYSYTRKEVQKIWDELLIDNFFKSEKPMTEHLRMFYLELGVTPADLTQSGQVIHRMPFLWKKEHREGNCRFFVSNYVSQLADILYKYEETLEKDKESILLALPKMKIRTTTEINDNSFIKDVKGMAQTSSDYVASKKERAAYSSFRDSSNSNWKKCK